VARLAKHDLRETKSETKSPSQFRDIAEEKQRLRIDERFMMEGRGRENKVDSNLDLVMRTTRRRAVEAFVAHGCSCGSPSRDQRTIT
jgi:hypothetical protein